MMLNLGDNFAEQTDIISEGGYHTRILTTLGKTLTPMQFLSYGDSWIVNGALMFDYDIQHSSVDSIMPVIDAVYRDVVHASKLLK